MEATGQRSVRQPFLLRFKETAPLRRSNAQNSNSALGNGSNPGERPGPEGEPPKEPTQKGPWGD